MEHPGGLVAVAAASTVIDAAMLRFDRVRALLIATNLPPEPDIYDLFWRHLGGEDFALSRAVEAALAAGALDLAAVAALRRTHCGDIALGDVSALVTAAHTQAVRIGDRLADGRSDLAEYGRTIADGDAALNHSDAPTSPAALAALIERLGAATGAMLVANRRLEVELAFVAEEAAALRDQLHRAECAAETDPLTGLLNRRGVTDFLAAARARAHAEGTALSVAMVDIDHFKRVNDRWGHGIGDEVLCYVARHLADGIAAIGDNAGAVGRIGGEEFLVMLPGFARGPGAAVIERLRASLAGQLIRRHADGTNLGRVSFSAGVAADRGSAGAETIEALIGRADAALYTAKRLGRDRVIPDRG